MECAIAFFRAPKADMLEHSSFGVLRVWRATKISGGSSIPQGLEPGSREIRLRRSGG